MGKNYSLKNSDAVFDLYKLITLYNKKDFEAIHKETGKHRVVILEQLEPLKQKQLVQYAPGTGVKGSPAKLIARKQPLLKFIKEESAVIRNTTLWDDLLFKKDFIPFWKESSNFNELIKNFDLYVKHGKKAFDEVSFEFD